ncbi:MAG: undecaprenyl-diphosphatase UppP [Candidatus Curtissbacteria bacterium]|nr:undecaprenyl-diphosphatase UppP [Candidatus Curtissbacteria bacterium]
MNYLIAVLAGALQGLTEFLPISSTGHLIIFENLFNISQDKFGLTFDASLHLGTLLAVAIFFYKDYITLLKTRNTMVLKLALGTIPAVIAGLLFENYIETYARSLQVVGISLIIFSIVFVLAEKFSSQKKSWNKTTFLDSLVIGIFQSLALIPGVSRSGATISAGLFVGLKREEAAKFAFMLSGPIIAGAGLMKFFKATSDFGVNSSEFAFFMAGMTSAAIFGYLTIKYFLKYLATNTLYPFVYYRVILGLILLIFARA